MNRMNLAEQKSTVGGTIYTCTKCGYTIDSTSYFAWYYTVEVLQYMHEGLRHGGSSTWTES